MPPKCHSSKCYAGGGNRLNLLPSREHARRYEEERNLIEQHSVPLARTARDC